MFRIGGIAYSPDHILAKLDPSSSQRCANRSGANDSDTHEYLLVSHENQASVFSARSKMRRQKMALETGAWSGASAATFRRRRPSHICETPRCHEVSRASGPN